MSTTASAVSINSTSTIIIRLQNLPNEARASDIRRFFAGLSIPDGGVHVVGGEKGDAFINFSSDEDARQAMLKTGNIFGNQIRLFLSSRSEMQSVIAEARAKVSSTANETNNPSKYTATNPLTALLADFQAKTNQPQNNSSFSSNTNGSLQQFFAALNEKPSTMNNVTPPTFPFPLPMMNNPMHTFNDSLHPQYVNALQQQQAVAAAAALLLHQPRNPSIYSHPMANNNAFEMNCQFLSNTTITADEPYIRVRNISKYYSYYNIKLLFAKYKLNLSDIKIINDQNGQRTGEVVLRLHTNHDVADILSQDGRIQCYNAMLDIKKIDEYTFASAIDSFVPGHVKKAPGATIKNCVRVIGFPRKYERKDVKKFFTGCSVTNRPGGIFIETDTANGPTFVEFETEIDAEKAFFYNGEQIGSSTIEMCRMTKSDMEQEINTLKRSPSERQSRRPPLLHEPTIDQTTMTCLRLKNIPYTTVEQEIFEFFSKNSTPIENCKILRDRLNRGAGEALVRFVDPQTCQLAFETKNRQIFHGRSLDLRMISFSEFQNAPLILFNVVDHGNNKRTVNFYERTENEPNRDKRARWDRNVNSNFHRNSPRQIKDNFGPNDVKTVEDSNESSNNNLPPLPTELNEFVGRILFLSNVAYRATREEILDFLRPFAPIPETLKIRCDSAGRPTGYGVVACETVADASRAVAELNNQTFMLRKISLQQR